MIVQHPKHRISHRFPPCSYDSTHRHRAVYRSVGSDQTSIGVVCLLPPLHCSIEELSCIHHPIQHGKRRKTAASSVKRISLAGLEKNPTLYPRFVGRCKQIQEAVVENHLEPACWPAVLSLPASARPGYSTHSSTRKQQAEHEES